MLSFLLLQRVVVIRLRCLEVRGVFLLHVTYLCNVKMLVIEDKSMDTNVGNVPASVGKVKVGDRAPDFRLLSSAGTWISLSDYLNKKPIVLYFYPKDETPGCTVEACLFRNNYQLIKEEGAEVIGISSDDEAAHQRFAQRHALPFILLSDKGGVVRKLYGVAKSLWLIPGRVTYIIDRAGIVRRIYSSQFLPEKHIVEAIKTLRTL